MRERESGNNFSVKQNRTEEVALVRYARARMHALTSWGYVVVFWYSSMLELTLEESSKNCADGSLVGLSI